jgi:hypothetical protein
VKNWSSKKPRARSNPNMSWQQSLPLKASHLFMKVQ